MINYKENGIFFHEDIVKAGLSLYSIDGVWKTDGDVQSVQKFIDDYDPLPTFKEKALLKIDHTHSFLLKKATGFATIEERDTWQLKLDAAKGYLANTATTTQKQMIEVEAPAYGYTPLYHANRVIEKSNNYALLVATLAGLREKAKLTVLACTTIDEIQIAGNLLYEEALAIFGG